MSECPRRCVQLSRARPLRAAAAVAWLILLAAPAAAGVLEVGAGKRFARIEQACQAARPGDVVAVFPPPAGQAYSKVAVLMRTPRVAIRAVLGPDGQRVRISGAGFDYSGRLPDPRAIFQFDPGADGCLLEGFELFGAANSSHNGAAVRINQANYVWIRNCEIRGNNMGIMSNGDRNGGATYQRIEDCLIHDNGDPANPGFNHNLYLGGTSVVITGCDIHSATTGHNVKSRAHHTRVEYSYIHHSSNREFDLVDDAATAAPDSHAVLVGNLIVKDDKCRGNRAVIHFGQDGGHEHDGTLYLVHNTIIQPFRSSVVDLSAGRAKAQLYGNLLCDGGTRAAGQRVADARNGASLAGVTGQYNWFSSGFGGPRTGLDARTNTIGRPVARMFLDPARLDFRLIPALANSFHSGLDPGKLSIPFAPGTPQNLQEPLLAWQFRPPLGKVRRAPAAAPILGAFADPVQQPAVTTRAATTTRPAATARPLDGLPPEVLRRLLIP